MIHASVDEPLSAGTLARRLGVATTTLRTWHQRYGLGPSDHQSGQHRRYTSRDIARLTVMAQLTTSGVPAAAAARQARRENTVEHTCATPPADAESRGLARAARRLDVLGLRETLGAVLATRGVLDTWHTLAGPALGHLGQARCPEAHRTVAVRLLLRTLSEVFAGVPRPAAGTPVTVLLVAVRNGRDVTALDVVAAALAERGIVSMHLGAGTPEVAIVAAVTRIRPAAMVLWNEAPGPMPPELIASCIGDDGWRPQVVEAGPGRRFATVAETVACVVAA